MEIYIFGSICRGDISLESDIDLLAITEGFDHRFDSNQYSIYSYDRIEKLWKEGNPFAWHLFLESKLIFSSRGEDFLRSLGEPSSYKNGIIDCKKFQSIFFAAKESLQKNQYSCTLDLSTVFLCIRNFATCFSLEYGISDFSRSSAQRLNEYNIPLKQETYSIYERARILCTRGFGKQLDVAEIKEATENLNIIENWMSNLLEVLYERV